ncbi:MAG TPA: type II secretion system F family protein [Thermoanaerobaculia bacterium]|nr:type II secretion system F family protein [Thermoanaerobaculia bacterium]
MPTFVFRVGTSDGQILERRVESMTLESATEEIRKQGLHVFSARRSGLLPGSLIPRSRRIISTERFLLFNQELAALIRAGLPILQSLDLMLERQRSPRFKQVLTEIRDKVQSGVALSDAFAAYGDAFPAIYSTSLRAGERSGEVEAVIRRFLRYQKLLLALRKKVVSALVYPTVLVFLAGGMIFLMLTYVIPKFSEFYQGFDAELPLLTRTLINFAFLVRNNTPLVIALLVVTFLMLRSWTRTDAGRRAIDAFKLRIPFVGGVLKRVAIMQFTQSLGTLLGGGTPMVPAIEIASQSVTNRMVGGRLDGIVQKVREGQPLWKSLEETTVMSDLAVEMVKVGESTGALVEMLQNASEFYDEEIEVSLSRAMSLIEPTILVILGVVIAVLLYAFYLPLFQLTSVAQQ